MDRTTALIYRTDSADATTRFGRALGGTIGEGMCISLVGALGAGKTVLAAGICSGLGIEDEVLSPTFVLYEEFQGRLPVVHIDLYRLDHESEIEELGVFDAVGHGKVILAEWGDRSDTMLNLSDVVIRLSNPAPGRNGDSTRRLDIRCTAAAAGLFEHAESW